MAASGRGKSSMSGSKFEGCSETAPRRALSCRVRSRGGDGVLSPGGAGVPPPSGGKGTAAASRSPVPSG
ncbi:hypothetical protein THAOC_22583, partial [Thalassiosira oceanica]